MELSKQFTTCTRGFVLKTEVGSDQCVKVKKKMNLQINEKVRFINRIDETLQKSEINVYFISK